MPLALLFHYLLLNMFIHPQELATNLMSYFMGCIVLVRCVLVLRCGLAGVVWYPYAGWSTSASASNKSQAPEDRCNNIRNMLSRNNKASDIKMVSLYSIIKMIHGPINISLFLD